MNQQQSMVNSAFHPMQGVYENMQLQHQLQPQQSQLVQQQMPVDQQHGMYANSPYQGYPTTYPQGSTTQNVSVVDFKPGVMAQHQMNQLQNQYQQSCAPPMPTMGVIGPDGRYQPVTAACAAYPRPDDYNPYNTRALEDSRESRYSQYARRSRYNNGMESDDFPGLDALVEKRVNERMRTEELANGPRTVKKKSNDPEPLDDAPVLNSAFNIKTQDEQRQIVGDAVRSVMDKYDLKATPKTAAAVARHRYDR
jgi:hypothetical protein